MSSFKYGFCDQILLGGINLSALTGQSAKISTAAIWKVKCCYVIKNKSQACSDMKTSLSGAHVGIVFPMCIYT